MLRVAPILLCFSLLFAGFYNTMAWLQFESNKAFYAREKCQQKEEVNNKCQGACQLKALLQTNTKKDPQLPEPKFLSETLEFTQSIDATNKKYALIEVEMMLSIKAKDGYHEEDLLHSIWRPPWLDLV
jgi:hypothetical protein